MTHTSSFAQRWDYKRQNWPGRKIYHSTFLWQSLPALYKTMLLKHFKAYIRNFRENGKIESSIWHTVLCTTRYFKSKILICWFCRTLNSRALVIALYCMHFLLIWWKPSSTNSNLIKAKLLTMIITKNSCWYLKVF